MKYKVGIKNNNNVVMTIDNEGGILVFEPSIIAPTNQRSKNVINIATPKCVGYEFFKDVPSLFKNPSFLSNVTEHALVIMYGTPNSVSHEEINAPVGFSLPNASVIDHPTVIPIQNIKFQKLSLFNRDLMKFIAQDARIFRLYNFIVSKFGTLCKAIRQLLVDIAELFVQICLAVGLVLKEWFSEVVVRLQENRMLKELLENYVVNFNFKLRRLS